MREKLIKLQGEKTITEVAKSLDITRQVLSAIESGTRTPSLELARRIAIYYSSTIEEIFLNLNATKCYLCVKEVRGMRITCVGELAEVSSVEESNKLLEEGWEFCKVFSIQISTL